MSQLKIGPYQFIQPLGLGGQASVWLATDERSGGQVAIKMLPPGCSQTELARLRRESQLLMSFSDPGLPHGIGLVEDDARRMWGFVMEYVRGTPIKAVAKERAIDAQSVAWFALELARVVSVLHLRGVVHRDVKPANVLVRDGWERGVPGSIVLVDLGIAKGTAAHATACTGPGKLVGSAPYVAPELLFAVGDSQPTPSVDVFSIGVLIWYLLFRNHPTGLRMSAEFFDFLEAYRSGSIVVPDSALADDIQDKMPGMIPVLYRCLEFSLERRYPHAGELHQALTRVLSRLETGRSDPPPGFAQPPLPQQNATFLSPTVAGAIPRPFGFETTRDDPASALVGVPATAPDAPVLSVPAASSQANPALITTMKSHHEDEPKRLGLIILLLIVTLVVAGTAGAGVMWWVTH